MDNHPSWTSWSLCEEGVDHRNPCPLTWGLTPNKQKINCLVNHQIAWDFTTRELVVILSLHFFFKFTYSSEWIQIEISSNRIPTLTSIHRARWGRPLRWRTSVANWGSSLHWRGASGWHPFKEGVSIPRIIIVFQQTRNSNIRNKPSPKMLNK